MGQVLGAIDGSGKITVVDTEAPPDSRLAVDLDLELVLGSMPNKTFRFERTPFTPQPLALPQVSSASRPPAQCACKRPSHAALPKHGNPQRAHAPPPVGTAEQTAVIPDSERCPIAGVPRY